MIFKYKFLAFWLLILNAVPLPMAFAQTDAVKPVSPFDTLVAEGTSKATLNWLGKVTGWENFQPLTYKIVRNSDTVYTMTRERAGGKKVQLRLDTTAFMAVPYGDDPAPVVTESSTTRPLGPLVSGTKWKSTLTAIGEPADWCPTELKGGIDSQYEVGPAEKFKLLIDEKETEISVLPVTERGIWRRCYTGNRYQRFLWSPDLQIAVAVEFQTYNPVGNLHAASFNTRIKGIVRGKESDQNKPTNGS